MSDYDKFIQVLKHGKIIRARVESKEKVVIERKCIPFDFGPLKININPNPNRYHF